MISKSQLAPDRPELSRWEWEGGSVAFSKVSGSKDGPSPLGGEAPGERTRAQPLTKVLVATDLSPGGDVALERALHLPCAPHATLTLLHVVHGGTDTTQAHEEEALLARRLEEARARSGVAAEGQGIGSLDIMPSMVPGNASAEIVRVAREQHSEVVVLGRHGKSAMRNLLLGSTVRAVLRRADAPVLVVSQPVGGPYRRPIVAVDFSEVSRRAAELAVRLSAPGTESIDVIHAHRDDEDVPLDLGPGEHDHDARSQIEQFLQPLADHGVTWNAMIERGDPGEVIVDAAASRGCDLIVLGATGRSNVDGTLFSRIAQTVVEIARCDVLVVR